MTAAGLVLSRRDLALLRATAAGRCELLCGAHPDLLIDGRWCCDQTAAHGLAAAGLLTAAVAAPPGTRVPAALTDTGRSALTTEGATATASRPPRPGGERLPEHPPGRGFHPIQPRESR